MFRRAFARLVLVLSALSATIVGLLALVAVGATGGSPAQSEDGGDGWRPAGRDNLLYAKVFKDEDTIASALSHNHVIRARDFQAWLSYDRNDPGRCRLSLSIPVRRLVVDEAWLRRKVGFDEPLDDQDRERVKKSMLAEDQLDARNHGHVSIEGKHCTYVAGHSQRVALELAVTVRGRTKRLATTVHVTETERWLRVQGSFRVQHSDFGIEPYSAFFGAVANAEPIELVADISWYLG